MNGMKSEKIITNLKQELINADLEVLFVTETLGSKEKEVSKVFKNFDVFYRGRKGKEKRKQYTHRGGIMCIARKGVVEVEQENTCDDLIFVKWRGIRVGCAYFVPPTSPFEKKNEKRMLELQQIVLASTGKVMILTDANAWIGQLPSVISKREEGYDNGERVFQRTTEKEETNKQGHEFLQAMNSIDMIILNGVRSKAKFTYDHPGREARSIVDYIVVSENMFDIVSDVSYIDCREELETDHILISVEVEHTNVTPTKRKKKRKKKQTKPIMELLKKITRKDPFWKCLEGVCERKFKEFTTEKEQPIEEDYKAFKAILTEAVTEAFQQAKPNTKTFKATIRSNPNLREIRKRKKELYKATKTEEDVQKRKNLKKELSRVSNCLKRASRKAINEYKREKVKEIESLEIYDCRRMWKELKGLSGWTRKEETTNTVLDEKKEEVSEEGIMRVWKEAFHLLGVEDVKDSKFDQKFCEKVLEQQEETYNESYDSTNVKKELDTPIELAETEEAIQRLKLGKAAGSDEIVAEVLKRGGDNVAKAVHTLCQKVWKEEDLPTDWTRGVIFPIYKDGDKRDPLNYRGITLLSIVGKIYAQIINERLIRWCEKNKVLVEEQGGFRPGRGCPDQLFTLVEVLKNRGEKPTYCCFIDVKKAFDRVFRAGLWSRVAEEGVKGKMWRVLVSIYKTVESCVKVDGNITEWFPVDTGVRQGCILSPLLYALFINGLVREINSLNKGIHITQEQKLSALLYADDIVLMCENRYDLQDMLDVVSKYAKKWRFELNPKKSEVVVFGTKYPPRNVEWKLGESKIKQVTKYKYLGIELTRTLKWHPYIKRVLAKAKRNMTQALAMGISGGCMTVRMANIVWMSLVRSIVEYGCEIWGDRDYLDLEKLQINMGKRILRCSSRTSEEVVRGELGWERQKARRDEMRLRYLGKILRMGEERIVRIVYNESRERLDREEASAKREHDITVTNTWCVYTRDLLKELHLEQVWKDQVVPPEAEWDKLIRDRIHDREEILWRTQCLLKPKLRTYNLLKKELRMEPYLEVHHRAGIPELAKLRGGTNRLRIEQGRYKKEHVSERICMHCESKEVEDEKHFMLICQAYKEEREDMWKQFETTTGTNRNSLASEEEKLNALIGDTYQPEITDTNKNSAKSKTYKEIVKNVMKYITTAMKKRRKEEEIIQSGKSVCAGAAHS